MNVVVVADYLYPDAVGGSWNYAHDLAQRLAAGGHRCFGISAHPGDQRPFRERIGAVEFYRYPLRRGSHALSFASRVAGSLRAFRQIAREHRIDLLHTHAPMGAIGACLAARAAGVRHVATLHGTGVLGEYLCEVRPMQAMQGSPAARLYCAAIFQVERWYLRRPRRLFALSRFSRDAFVRQYRLEPDRVTILPPGVDLERFRPGPRDEARRYLCLPLDRPIVLSVRRLTPRMGLDRLIRAARLVKKRVPEVLMVIGGQGPVRPALEALIEELGLEENVRLAGFIADDVLPLYYQAADLFALPSLASEGFGLVTLEALACDLPVLATPVGASPELLEPLDPKLLFADTSPEAMAEGLLAWLKRQGRPSFRAWVAEQYRWERCVEEFEAAVSGSESI